MASLFLDQLVRIVDWHLQRHPAFGPEDLVKLCYQAVLGMDHLLADRDRFARDFTDEWQALETPAKKEPLLEPIRVEPPMARLNLRAAKQSGFALSAVLDALVVQSPVGGSMRELLDVRRDSLRWARSGKLPFSEEVLTQCWRKAGDGPLSHSVAYRLSRQPAYRLVHDLRGPTFRSLITKGSEL